MVRGAWSGTRYSLCRPCLHMAPKRCNLSAENLLSLTMVRLIFSTSKENYYYMFRETTGSPERAMPMSLQRASLL